MTNRSTDLRLIASVTEHFFFWQGLRWVPLGFALLAGFVIPHALVPKAARVTLMMIFMAAAFAVSCAAGRWYGRTYGTVHGIPGRHARRERLKWNVVYPLILVSLIADALWRGPFFLSGPVWAAAILAYRNSTGGGRTHYFVIAALVAALGFAPLFVGAGKPMFNLFFLVLGGAYIIGGLLDHVALTRILGTDDHARSL
jgi:hypothetical protein